MKKVRTTIAAIAVIAITAGATFAANNNQKSAAINDCWSTQERLEQNLPPDVDQQSTCPGLEGECCYKPGGEFGFPEI